MEINTEVFKKSCEDENKSFSDGIYKESLDEWEKYREKILGSGGKTLTLEDYAGKFKKGEKDDNNLVHFLAYGSAPFVNLTQCVPHSMIQCQKSYKDENGKSVQNSSGLYSISKEYEPNADKKPIYEADELEPYFKVYILPLIKLIVSAFEPNINMNKVNLDDFFPKGDFFPKDEKNKLLEEKNKLLEEKKDLLKNVKDKLSECGSNPSECASDPEVIDVLEKIQQTKLYELYGAKGFLVKIMNIESARSSCRSELRYMLANITENKVVDFLYKSFIDHNAIETKNGQPFPIRRSYMVMKEAYTMAFELDFNQGDEIKRAQQRSLSKQMSIYHNIWKYATDDYLKVSEGIPNVIFYGSPGTGKTYTVDQGIDLRFMSEGGSDNIEVLKQERVATVQCHPGFGYEEFLEGLKPVGFTDKGIKLEIVNGAFKDLCIRAKNDLVTNKEAPHEYFFVADEINRANLSAMFGETLSLLETDYRDFRKDEGDGGYKRKTIRTPLSTLIEAYINESVIKDDAVYPTCKAKIDKIKELAYECDLVYDEKPYSISYVKVEENKVTFNYEKEDGGEKKTVVFDPQKVTAKNVTFGVPRNIRFIGMMNDVDKSIDAFDLALRRRFKWIKKKYDEDVLRNILTNAEINDHCIVKYLAACQKLNEYISSSNKSGLGFGESYQFGHAYYKRILDYVKQNKNIKEITKDNRNKFFDEHLEPVLTEYIRSFYEESRIEECIKSAKVVFTNGMG